MVHLDVVRAANAALVQAQPIVAVFIGGTSGIGKETIHALAATHSTQGKGLRVYIVGRNGAAAEKIISECTRVCPGGRFRFVRAADLALLKDVDRVCAEIIRLEEEEEKAGGGTARVDLLVLTQAVLNFHPRNETKEGLDTDMSLLYYSRMRFVTQLLPLLLPTTSTLPSPAPAAHVISVFAAGMESKLFPSDLSLREPGHYTFANRRSHVVYMKTLFMETLAKRHASGSGGRGLSLAHVYPSLVVTEAFGEMPMLPTWFRVLWRWVLGPLLTPFSVPPRESGERVLFLATPRFPPAGQRQQPADKPTTSGDTLAIATGSDGHPGSGAYSMNWDGEPISAKKLHRAYKDIRPQNLAQRVWDHTMAAFDEIEAGNVFKG